ncbi:hypothetical protein NDU88_000780 [Pleurodeles waltl]|uniref:Uncharacterized protein n=1 Tax=Pleurodeles waltl TaxID=8319 RepID=A0AAV7R6Q9_PLEWA|nr:hypothetical protein NDU88_000780 [Pleurodeles waltl]
MRRGADALMRDPGKHQCTRTAEAANGSWKFCFGEKLLKTWYPERTGRWEQRAEDLEHIFLGTKASEHNLKKQMLEINVKCNLEALTHERGFVSIVDVKNVFSEKKLIF